MEPVLRAFIVYALLFLIFRISGRRTLAQITPFDLVLTLIIGESIQGALVDDDRSLTGAFLIVITLVGLDIILSIAKVRSRRVARLLDGLPVLVIDRGTMLRDAMRRERVDESDILTAAREQQALSRVEDIEYAVLEETGKLGILPRDRQPR